MVQLLNRELNFIQFQSINCRINLYFIPAQNSHFLDQSFAKLQSTMGNIHNYSNLLIRVLWIEFIQSSAQIYRQLNLVLQGFLIQISHSQITSQQIQQEARNRQKFKANQSYSNTEIFKMAIKNQQIPDTDEEQQVQEQSEEESQDQDDEVIYIIEEQDDQQQTNNQNQAISQKINKKYKFNPNATLFKKIYADDMEIQVVQRKPKTKKPKTKRDHIDANDITEIIIIILLVLILGISLFRVILEVQVQYKNAQELQKNRKNGIKRIQETSLVSGLPNNLNQQNSNKNINLSQQRLNEQKKTISNSPGKKNVADSEVSKKSTPAQNPAPVIIKLTPECQNYINKLLEQNGSLYDFKFPSKQFRAKSRIDNYMGSKSTGISKEQYSQAIQLLGIVHRVDRDGNLNIQNSACETAQSKRQRLTKAMDEQKKRFNTRYHIDQYQNNQLRFCLVVNSYNNAKNGLIFRNLDSIFQQNYQNFHVVYTDDHSQDQTGLHVKEYLKKNNITEDYAKVIVNQKKFGMMQNIYKAITFQCQLGQIVVMLDGDDSFVGVNVLSLVNALYQKQKLALMWANFICIFSNTQANMGFSRDYAQRQKKQNSFRKLRGFISSHLKTFYVDVFRKIKPQDLQSNNGHFYGGASDTAMMVSMIEMANPKTKYLPQILYQYRYDTGQVGNTVNKIPQKEALQKIFASKPYEGLKDFSFIDSAIKNAKNVSQKIQIVYEKIQTINEKTESNEDFKL